MAFHVGQKVTMIEDGIWWSNFSDKEPNAFPQFGVVYEVAEVLDYQGHGMLAFNEWPKHGWEAECFRPVVEPKTDISIFTAMLTPKKATVQA